MPQDRQGQVLEGCGAQGARGSQETEQAGAARLLVPQVWRLPPDLALPTQLPQGADPVSAKLQLDGEHLYVVVVQSKRYGFWKFIGDCFMVVITWGFWLIWICP